MVLPAIATELPKPSSVTVSEPRNTDVRYQPAAVLVNRSARLSTRTAVLPDVATSPHGNSNPASRRPVSLLYLSPPLTRNMVNRARVGP